jgi:predicted NBD/HSP70 family sugar kinase
MTRPTGWARSGQVGVLAVGGTHVTSARASRQDASLVLADISVRRLDSGAGAEELLGELAGAMAEVNAAPGTPWGIAMPGPFDYQRGVGLFEGVGKFEALFGVDVGAGLRARLADPAAAMAFVNDADAFAIGEWSHGVAAGAARCAGITLGTGVGSAFLDHGSPVTDGPDVPPHGRAHYLKIGTRDLEDVVSRRAILARYRSRADRDSADLDVREVFDRARRGDDWAARVLADAFLALGVALAPWLTRFEASVVAFGGAMTGSWDLIRPPIEQGLATAGAAEGIALLLSADTERSALLGAATCAAQLPG